MNQFIIPVSKDNSTLNFEIRDYPHDGEHTCRFEIYLQNKFAAGFEPDRDGHLHICKNLGNIENNTLYCISDRIEKYHW